MCKQPHPTPRHATQPKVAEHVHRLGLKLGIYSSRGGTTCGGRPGSGGHAALDADTFARWGVDYLKLDSCKGGAFHPNATSFDDPEVAWQEYAAVRDALNATGRPIWYSITERVLYNDSEWHAAMHCIRPPRPAGSCWLLYPCSTTFYAMPAARCSPRIQCDRCAW